MKRQLLLLAFLAVGLGIAPLKAQRYLSEVFTTNETTLDVVYGGNISVLTGAPAADTLRCDIYTPPTTDTLANRPTVLIAHTGSFLPTPLNGQCTGARTDSVVVEMCRQFARRGFVAVAFSYRLGWNPISSDQDVRTSTLINAAYRGIQDAFTCVRYLRATVAGGNPYGVDENNLIIGGIGTGGYISFGANFLDDIDEIFLPKFFNFTTNEYYVDTSLSGDIQGLLTRPLNVANHTNFSSDFAMAFNMGGACGDSTWIDGTPRPHVSFHVPNDPFAPYEFGPVIVPATGDFVVNVSGSYDVQRILNGIGSNNPFISAGLSDPYTLEANTKNDGYDALFPYFRPSVESGPWEYYDTTVCNQPNPTNPDMSQMKSLTYIDSTMNYLVPRIVCGLGLAECSVISEAAEELELGAVSVYPNPSSSNLTVASTIGGNLIRTIDLIDLNGRTVFRQGDINLPEFSFDHQSIEAGLYFLKISTNKGLLTQKVVLK